MREEGEYCTQYTIGRSFREAGIATNNQHPSQRYNINIALVRSRRPAVVYSSFHPPHNHVAPQARRRKVLDAGGVAVRPTKVHEANDTIRQVFEC